MSGTIPEPDWASGPAKWAAIVVLGVASVVGVGWSITTDIRQPVDDPRPSAETDPLDDAVTVMYRIDVNSADAAELELLPRIGPALAGRIVADRDQNGLFADLDELDRVRGIGPKTIERLREFAEAR